MIFREEEIKHLLIEKEMSRDDHFELAYFLIFNSQNKYFRDLAYKYIKSDHSLLYVPEVAIFLEKHDKHEYDLYIKRILAESNESYLNVEDCNSDNISDKKSTKFISKKKLSSKKNKKIAKKLRQRSLKSSIIKSRNKMNEKNEYKEKLEIMIKKIKKND